MALQLGDPTAKRAGRLTLNPLKHIDPVGTIIVPVALKIMGAPVLGWAKPVPVNFAGLNNPKRDMIWVALAGPLTNLIIASFLSKMLIFVQSLFWAKIISMGIIINLVLAVFNLIPIPPLDGSRIVMGLLPNKLALSYSKVEPFGLIIVIVLLSLGMFRYVWVVVSIAALLLGVDPSVLN